MVGATFCHRLLQQALGLPAQPGDIALWGPVSAMGLHANIVVATDPSTITTVGGNEGGISVRRSAIDSEHLLGFGRPA